MKVNSPFLFSVLCLVLGAFFFACNPAKNLPDGSYLLTKTTIRNENKNIDKDELNSILKQHPNRKILGLLRFHLRVFNFASRGKDRKWKNWLKTVGEEPVIIDSALTRKSSHQLNIYLKNKGYFNSTVADSTVFKNNKTAQVMYSIISGAPYKVNRIITSINDNELVSPVRTANTKSMLNPGMNYDTDIFTRERERMANAMKNLGYYNFSKEYIFFQMDSALANNKVDVKQTIKNPYTKITVDEKDSLIESKHRLYYIRNIYINSNYHPQQKSSITEDTLIVGDYCFLGASTLRFKPEVLLKSIFIETDDLYSLENVDYTQSRLAALKTFKFISIRFDEVSARDTLRKYLDCYILLTPTPRQSMTLESEGTNRSGNLGVAGEVAYRNKNIFKGAEVLEIKFRGGLEAQKLAYDNDTTKTTLLGENVVTEQVAKVFNTFEISPEANLFFPNLLIPFGWGGFLRPENPKTKISASYNFQQRADYTRHISNTAFGYSWKTSVKNSHAFFPFDVSIIKIMKSDEFSKRLDEIQNPFYTNSFTDHLISASKYSYTFSNQKPEKSVNYMFFRWNVESAGNILRQINKSLGTKADDENAYHLFNSKDKETGNIDPTTGIRYAQYVKTDIDLRFYNIINIHSNVVYRIFAGIGKPLANFNSLPFVKSYFGGGANGIRAWTARSLGPGSSENISGLTIDKIGDIQLEGNMEYRFDLIKILDGAAFIDAGNVWLLKKKDPAATPSGSDFNVNRFYNEIAVGAGLGARLDFDFFIIRLDAGVKIKDPSLPLNERWAWQQTNYKPRPNYNLGIGYPF